MKKTYIAPAQTIVILNLHGHLMQESYDIDDTPADTDGFVKEDFSFRDRSNVWDDDWDD